jgi:cell division protein FtsZ
MKEAGAAIVGVGTSTSQNRALEAATQALNSPLLEFSIEGARGVLFGISGGRDMRMSEINDIAKAITATVDPSARIIFGAYHDRKLKAGALKVTLIATGFSGTVKTSPELMSIPSLFGDIETSAKETKPESKNTAPVTKEREREREQAIPKDLRRPVEKIVTANTTTQTKEGSGIKEFKIVGSAEKKTPPPQPAQEPTQSESSTWEIPAFLRRKRSRE